MSGATVWITGLPAAGKTTLAEAVAPLVENALVLDGDALRRGPSQSLGFSPADRGAQAQRTAAAALDHAAAGGVAIVALVSPYRSDRAAARAAHDHAGVRFLEVWVDTPLAECERRDPKGLYARARAGELEDLTGVDAPYEAPAAAEVVVAPDRAPEGSARAVVGALGLNPAR